MTYIKINETLYPATVNGRMSDADWDNRESKAITLEMDYATAIDLFVDGLAWSIVQQDEVPVYQVDENGNAVLDEKGNPIQTGTEMQETEWDNSEYDIAGPITDNRNGTITTKMGKITAAEALAELMEVLA
jgi:hypothetical protein